jgi:hypothetical protein
MMEEKKKDDSEKQGDEISQFEITDEDKDARYFNGS